MGESARAQSAHLIICCSHSPRSTPHSTPTGGGGGGRRGGDGEGATYFAMTLGAFLFWQSMEKVHVWIALHQDEKLERLEKEAEIKRVREELLAQAKHKDSLV